jgi:hypothetical protein
MTDKETSVDRFCEEHRSSNGVHSYGGDYQHQLEKLNDYWDAYAEQNKWLKTPGQVEEMRRRSVYALQNRMQKFYNVNKKYDSRGHLREL